MHVGEQMARMIKGHGTGHVFGVPGGQTLPLYEGLRDTEDVEHVLMHDERSGGFAADAYARVTLRTGVCDATVGPGATNLPSAVAEAYASSVPMIAIMSDLERRWEARKRHGTMSQGMFQREMFREITKECFTITDAGSAAEVTAAAFQIANAGRPGPVALFVPEDVFREQLGEAASAPAVPDRRAPWFRTAPDPEVCAEAVARVAAARRPAILAGGGVHLSQAEDVLGRLAAHLGCPVATTISGKGSIAESSDWALGVAGSMGRAEANATLAEADCVILVGTKAGQVATSNWELPTPGAAIIQIDVDANEIGRSYPGAVQMVGDARLCLEQLLAGLQARGTVPSEWQVAELAARRDRWVARELDTTALTDGLLRPQRVMALLSEVLGDEDVVAADASLSSGWASSYTVLRTAGRRFLAPRGMGGLGWGIPAGIGAACGLSTLPGGQRRVWVVAGDGGAAFSIAELEVMARLHLPVSVVLLNNDCLGWIKQTQAARNVLPHTSIDFAPVDFAALSRAYGVEAWHCEAEHELKDALASSAQSDGPSLIQVPVGQSESSVLRLAARLADGSGAPIEGEGL